MKNTLANATVIGFFSMPSPAVAEHNPSAYYAAMARMPRNAGTCSHCGTGIMHHVIIRDVEGKTRFIGTQCAEKVGIDPEALRLRKSREQIDAEKAAREQYLANFDASVFDGGKYAGRKIADVLVDDEQYVRWFANNVWFSKDEQKLQQATCKALLAPAIAAEQASRNDSRQKLIAVLGEQFLRSLIDHNQQNFCHSMALQILGIRFDYRDSWNPVELKEEAHSLPTGRALNIMLEIKAKCAGRRNSKAYNAAYEALELALAS